jgi:hypothetical protein
MILPLQNNLLMLRKLREEFPAIKAKKAIVTRDILRLKDEINNAEDSEEERDLIEQMDLFKKDFLDIKGEYDTKKRKI